MKFAPLEGKTILSAHIDDSQLIYFSILSKRAANIVLKLSSEGRWEYPVVPYDSNWENVLELDEGQAFRVIGFQPQTGFHLMVKK